MKENEILTFVHYFISCITLSACVGMFFALVHNQKKIIGMIDEMKPQITSTIVDKTLDNVYIYNNRIAPLSREMITEILNARGYENFTIDGTNHVVVYDKDGNPYETWEFDEIFGVKTTEDTK